LSVRNIPVDDEEGRSGLNFFSGFNSTTA